MQNTIDNILEFVKNYDIHLYLSLLIPIISCIYTYKNFQLKKMVITQQNLKLKIKLDQAFTKIENGVNYANFLITLINQSSLKSTIVIFELEVAYTTKSSTPKTFILDAKNANQKTLLNEPCEVSARSAESRLVVFALPARLKDNEVLVKDYTVVGTLQDGSKIRVRSHLLSGKA